MTLQQLRYFLALCEEQSFTRAARRCGVKQPSLTRAIKELEAEFGGPLFERSQRTNQLSRLGTIVRPHFAVIDRATADAKRDAADFLAARPVLPFKPTLPLPIKAKENTMRKVAFGAAITAAMLLLVTVYVRLPRSADAAPPPQASKVMDIDAIQSAIEVKALPREKSIEP